MDNNSRKITYAALFIGLLCASSNLHANESPVVSRTIAETTKDYLSDPARTGSLVGSIIAGSAVANPLAPVLGSVVGFVIGKSSAFSKKNDGSTNQNAYSKRSLMPTDGTEITSLSLESGASNIAASSTSTLATSGTSTLAASGTPTLAASGTPTLATSGTPTLATSGISTLPTVPIDDATATTLTNTATAITLTGSATAFSAPEVPELAAAQPRMNSDKLNEIVIVEETNSDRIATTIETIVPTDLVQEAEMGITSIQLTHSGMKMESAGSSDLQKRLAEACSNYRVVKTASLNCYYNTQ